MKLGIDVGGTFTDAVIINDDNRVLASAKARTSHGHLMDGLLAALDAVLEDGAQKLQALNPVALAHKIQQVTLSTTVVTNAIVSGHIDAVDLYVVPGPGMNISHSFPVEPIIVKGYTDHRGMVQERMSAEDVIRASEELGTQHKGEKRAAISAKFSVRNPKEELRLASILREDYGFVSAGSLLSGSLNFPRRTVSAYYNSAVASTFANFKEQVTRALDERGIMAPLYILKADGGSLPIDKLADRPVETAFTGPAASVLGLQALRALHAANQTSPEGAGAKHGHMAVAIDIGGTSTDISLWENGQPIMTKEGVAIEGYPSSIRSFLVRSIGVAGETAVRLVEGQLQVGPDRVGPSVALGGSVPTLGDALVCLGHASYGDKALAQKAMDDLRKDYRPSLLQGRVEEEDGRDQQDVSKGTRDFPVCKDLTREEMAQQIVSIAGAMIRQAVDQMIGEANRQPVYVVEDLVHRHIFKPHTLVAIGGSAQAFQGLLEEAFPDYELRIPQEAPVTNAIGAAMARHTLSLTIHVDTKAGLVTVPELGMQEENHNIRWGYEAEEYGYHLLAQEAAKRGLEAQGMECIFLEEFPVVEGWGTSHRLITAKVQLEAGVTDYVQKG